MYILPPYFIQLMPSGGFNPSDESNLVHQREAKQRPRREGRSLQSH